MIKKITKREKLKILPFLFGILGYFSYICVYPHSYINVNSSTKYT
jgi:hypothetical protein